MQSVKCNVYFFTNVCFVDFHNKVKEENKWNNVIKYLFDQGIPVHIVVFENLVKDPIKEMRAVMKFLEKEIGFKQNNLERRLLCLNQNLEGNQKRKSGSKLTNDQVYTKELKEIVNDNIRNAQKYFVEKDIPLNISSYLMM